MECLPKDIILKFNENTLDEVRKIYDLEKPGVMKAAVDILVNWVREQSHFTTNEFSREYLERTIITTKGSVERAKKRIDKICTLRTLTPQFFGDYDVKEYFKKYYYNTYVHAALPRLTEDNYRVFIMKSIGDNFDWKTFMDYYRNIIIFAEYFMRHDYAVGYIFIVDYLELSLMDFLPKLNPVDLSQTMTVLMQGYGVRIKGIHILTPSKLVNGAVTIFKQVLSGKVGERIQVHKDIESLYNIFQKKILPKDYGGEEKSIKEFHDDWVEVLSSEEHSSYQRAMNRARTNEALRQKDTFNEEYMGMPGTFRTFSVD